LIAHTNPITNALSKGNLGKPTFAMRVATLLRRPNEVTSLRPQSTIAAVPAGGLERSLAMFLPAPCSMPAQGGTMPSGWRRSTTACPPTCDVRGRDLEWQLNVDSGRPLCWNSGHSPTAWQTPRHPPNLP